MTAPNEARRRLAAALARRDRAAEALDNAEADVRAAALDAVSAGLRISEVSQIVGVTRQTVYNWKREEP